MSAITIAQAAERYRLGRFERQEIAKATARSFRETLRLFAAFVGRDRPFTSITRHDVEEWIKSQGSLGPNTIRLRVGTVHGLFKWGQLEGIVKLDPTFGVRTPKKPRYLPRGLRDEEVAAVLDECPDARERLIVYLMVKEGLRAVEVSRLQIHDVDPDERTIVVTGKGGHMRILPVGTVVWQAIEVYLSERGRTAGHLIRPYQRSYAAEHDGISEKYVARLVGNAFRRAGVKASGHALRHTFAARLLDRGGNLRDLQSALGHVSIATTQVYTPYTAVRDLRELMDAPSPRPATTRQRAS